MTGLEKKQIPEGLSQLCKNCIYNPTSVAQQEICVQKHVKNLFKIPCTEDTYWFAAFRRKNV